MYLRKTIAMTYCGFMLCNMVKAQDAMHLMREDLIAPSVVEGEFENKYHLTFKCNTDVLQGQDGNDALSALNQYANTHHWRKAAESDVMGGHAIVFLTDSSDLRKVAFTGVGMDSMIGILNCTADRSIKDAMSVNSPAKSTKKPVNSGRSVPNAVWNINVNMKSTTFCHKYKCVLKRIVRIPGEYFPEHNRELYLLNNGLTLEVDRLDTSNKIFNAMLDYTKRLGNNANNEVTRDFASLAFGPQVGKLPAKLVMNCRDLYNEMLWKKAIYKDLGIGLKCGIYGKGTLSTVSDT